MDIRRLSSSDDLKTCASIMVSSSPWNRLAFSLDQCLEDLTNPGMVVHGAVGPEGEILGFMGCLPNGIGFEPMIEYVCVREAARGGGIGTQLINMFERELYPDADNLYLFVSDINPRAMNLYVRLGYQQVGALANFNLVSQTEFLLRKSRRPRQASRMAHQQDEAV